jgi:hypothetical protein
MTSSLTSSKNWSRATANFDMNGAGIWTRMLYSYREDPETPILRIRDSFDGGWADRPKVFSLNLMAKGEVKMDDGSSFTPPARRITPDQGSGSPSVTAPRSLGSGVSRLGFIGQWKVDFDVFIVASQPTQVYIGNWGHDWAYARERDEYSRVTGGGSFVERQHILRLLGKGDFDVVIIPYPKGVRPSDLTLAASGGGLILTMNGKTRNLPN